MTSARRLPEFAGSALNHDRSASSFAPAERQIAAHGYEAFLRGGPVVIVPRKLQGGVAAALDALPPAALPRLRFEGPVAELGPRLRRAVGERLDKPRWLFHWLVEDLLHKAGLMADLTGAPAIDLKLDVVEDDRCRAFHVDNVRLRLLTTYRGPGTEWIPPRVAETLPAGATPSPDLIRRLARGEVALFRGGRDATPERPGVLHRSPPIAGSGQTRLLLSIDEAGRRLH